VVVVAAALQRWGNGLGERWDEVGWSRGGGLDVAADADAGDSETEETRRCVQGRRRKGGSAAAVVQCRSRRGVRRAQASKQLY